MRTLISAISIRLTACSIANMDLIVTVLKYDGDVLKCHTLLSKVKLLFLKYY